MKLFAAAISTALIWLAGLALPAPPAAEAADHCSVKVDRRDGTIFVAASHVSGTLRWGTTLGQELTAVHAAASCTTPGCGWSP